MTDGAKSHISKGILTFASLSCVWLGYTWAFSAEKMISLVVLMLLFGLSMLKDRLAMLSGAALLLVAAIPFMSPIGVLVCLLLVEQTMIVHHIRAGGDEFKPITWALSWLLLIAGIWLHKIYFEAELLLYILLFVRASQWPFKNMALENNQLEDHQKKLLAFWLPMIAIFVISSHASELKTFVILFLVLLSSLSGDAESVAVISLSGLMGISASTREMVPGALPLLLAGFWGRIIAAPILIYGLLAGGVKDYQELELITIGVLLLASYRSGEKGRPVVKSPQPLQWVYLIIGVVFGGGAIYRVTQNSNFQILETWNNSQVAVGIIGGLALAWHLALLKWPKLGAGLRDYDLLAKITLKLKNWRWKESFSVGVAVAPMLLQSKLATAILYKKLDAIAFICVVAAVLLIMGGALL